MKKYLILIAIILLVSIDLSYAEDISINGEAGILMNYDTGEVLFNKSGNIKLYPASTTKILTAILAVENSKLDELITVDQEVVDLADGSHIALEPGEQLSMKEMLHALLISSSNDSALAIAKHVGGSVDGFSKMMNEKAREIGALDSNFVNPNGLHDEKHVSTAYDLALIGSYAIKNEIIRDIVKKDTYTIDPTNKKDEARYLKSTNKLLYASETISVDGKSVPIKYEGVLGLKTGYTSNAMNCLVTYAEKDGQRFITSVLKAEGSVNVYQDTHNLLNYGFRNYKTEILRRKNEYIDNIMIHNGDIPYVAGILSSDISISTRKDESLNLKEELIISDDLTAPITKGQVLGTIKYIKDDKILGQADIISTAGIDIKESVTPGIFERFSRVWYVYLFAFIILMKLIGANKKRRKRKARARRRENQRIYTGQA